MRRIDLRKVGRVNALRLSNFSTFSHILESDFYPSMEV
jgi:hypothetical protein